MIIRNASIFSKGQKTIILAISLAIDIFVIIVLVSSLVVTYWNNNSVISDNIPTIALISLVGTISFGDFIAVVKKRKSIALVVIQWFVSKTGDLPQFGIQINTQQRQFCERITGRNEDHALIYLFGKENKGKSTAVLYLLKGLLINSDRNTSFPWFNDITFIDCTNNREEIVNFFNMHDSVLNRIKKFSNCLVVIDNIECLGPLFIEENVGLFSSSKSVFILIEDTHDSAPMYNIDNLSDALFVYDFNASIISAKSQINLYKELFRADEATKKVFFALYFSTLVSSFVKIKTICDILKIQKRKFKKAFRIIQKMGIFLIFPFNKSYCYCFRKKELDHIDTQFYKDLTYNSILNTYIKSYIVDSETKWRCLIRSSLQSIELLSQKERYDIFHKALYGGNYKGLYDELIQNVKMYPEKSTLFLYERAFLSFYVGNHEEAATCYNELINSQKTLISKKELMLRIIESSHGNPNPTNMNTINAMISTLEEANDFYSLCAKYWKIHILSEKGIFLSDEMENIRNSISMYSDHKYRILQRSILHRTYTDEIRFFHILGIDCLTSLYEEYEKFLSTCNSNRYDYYCNLYIEANNIHYILLLDAVLSEEPTENIEDLVRTGDFYYNKALNSPYNDEKSKRASVVKQADLQMMYWDFNYEDVIQKINSFRLHSQLNNVGVHEAYCETLLMKAAMVNPNIITNTEGLSVSLETVEIIHSHYKKASQIYGEYQNAYGVFRADFLMAIFDLFVCKPNETQSCFDKLISLSKNNPQYSKEQKIVDALFSRKKTINISKLFIFSIIKAYPIVLQ